MKKILVLCGLKGSGKDTVADYIISKNSNWEKDSFAGTLKDVTSVLFGWDRKMLAGETPSDRAKREEKDEYWSEKFGREITPRNMLQFLGTDVLRTYLHPDIWVNALERKIVSSNKDIIITDCRFKNEIDMLRSRGATIIRIERGELPIWFSACEEIGKNVINGEILYPEVNYGYIPALENIHKSEWDWIGYDNPDYIIKNDGTLKELYSQIDEIMKA